MTPVHVRILLDIYTFGKLFGMSTNNSSSNTEVLDELIGLELIEDVGDFARINTGESHKLTEKGSHYVTAGILAVPLPVSKVIWTIPSK